MVKKSKHNAFSVFEIIFTLLIVFGVIICTNYIGKNNKNSFTLDGNKNYTFACWWDCNNKNICQVKQSIYLDNNLKKEEIRTDGACEFSKDKHDDSILIIASGAGSAEHAGRVVSFASSDFSGSIKPGRFIAEPKESSFNEGITKLSDVDILPGLTYANGLQPENLIWDNACKLFASPTTCPEKCSKFVADSPAPVGCYVANNLSQNTVVKIKGCECEDKIEADKNSFLLSDLKKSSSFLDRLSVENINKLSKTQEGNFYVTSDKNFKFKFILKNSNYDTRNNPQKYKNFSRMTQLLNNIPDSKRNDLITKLIKSLPGAPGRNGAVVILW